MKKLISMLISISMIMAMLPAFVTAEGEEGNELPKYVSNANFTVTDGDGTWDNGLWKAQYYHPDWWSYVNLTDVHQDNANYTDNKWDWSGAAIKVSGNKLETTKDSLTKIAVRAFTAPHKGKITIDATTAQDNSGNGVYIRITKTNSEGQNSKVLWGTDWNNNTSSAYTPIYAWCTVNQEAIENIEVEKGDIIRFEAASMSEGVNGITTWVNTISYTYIEPEATPSPSPTASPTTSPTAEPDKTPAPDKKEFVSNENFTAVGGSGTWDNGLWTANCYVQDWWIYSALTDVSNGKYNLGWLEGGLAKVDGSTLETDTIAQNFTARGFTVTHNGIIRIESATITNKSASAAKVQIRRKTAAGDLKHIWKNKAIEIEANGTLEQDAIELEISKDDVIYFEAATANDGTGVTVEWVNTVKYIDEFSPKPTPTPTPKPTPAPPLEDGIYKSSHNFIPEEGVGVWENVWSSQIYNSADGTYTDAKTEYGGGYAENNTDGTQPVVYGDRMKVSGADNPDKHPVRKFVVPKNGNLRILESEITHKTWEEIQYNIKLNDTVIWTANHSDCSEKLIQPEQRLKDVKQGDVIRFEAILKEGTSYGYEQLWENTILYWDGTEPTPTPIPTPTPDPDFNKTLYRASDSWSMEENGDNVWKWQSYNVAAKAYEDLPVKLDSTYAMSGEPNGEGDWIDGSAWVAGEDWRWPAVGKYTMHARLDPDPTSEEMSSEGKPLRDYAVRTFTSPKNGSISIQAADNKISTKTAASSHIRIMCQRADGSKPIQIFPAENWLNLKGDYVFEPIELDMSVGDKLMFEDAYIFDDYTGTPWDTYIRWDPIVEYKTVKPKLIEVSPSDGAENVPLNAEHILTYDDALNDTSPDRVTVYEVNAESESVNSSAICSSIKTDGASLKFVLDGLKPYTKYFVKVDGICYKGFDTKNEKSETVTFTTGPEINIGDAQYANGKVSVSVNNPYKEKKKATLIAAVCKGTESKYSIEKVYYTTRSDIGADDVIETEAELLAGADYFIKAIVMEDMQKARAYAPASIVRR